MYFIHYQLFVDIGDAVFGFVAHLFVASNKATRPFAVALATFLIIKESTKKSAQTFQNKSIGLD